MAQIVGFFYNRRKEKDFPDHQTSHLGVVSLFDTVVTRKLLIHVHDLRILISIEVELSSTSVSGLLYEIVLTHCLGASHQNCALQGICFFLRVGLQECFLFFHSLRSSGPLPLTVISIVSYCDHSTKKLFCICLV